MKQFNNPQQPQQGYRQQPQQQYPHYPEQQQYNYPPQNAYPQTPPPQKKKSRKKLWIIVGVVVALIVIGAIGSALGSARGSTSTGQSTPTTQPTQAQKLTIDQQINQIVQSAVTSPNTAVSHYNVGGDQAEVIDEQTQGNLTNGMTVEQIKIDCWGYQKALWTSSVASQISEVNVRIDSTLQDQYGNTSNGMIGSCDLTKATEQKFNWGNLDQDMAWGDYDNTYILSSLNS